MRRDNVAIIALALVVVATALCATLAVDDSSADQGSTPLSDGTPDRSGYTGDCRWDLYGNSLVISGSGSMKDYGDSIFTDAPWGTNIESVKICEGVTHIGARSFSMCMQLRSVEIADSVTSVGFRAFETCSNWLSTLSFSDNLTYIGDHAFTCCYGLKELHLGNSVQHIGEYVISYCHGLKEINLGNSLQYIGEYAFYNSSLESLVIPDTVTFIGAFSLDECTKLTDLTVPVSLDINSAHRSGILPISHVTFTPGTGVGYDYCDTVYSAERILDNYNFIPWHTSYLTSVSFEDGVRSIGEYMFCGCTTLTEVSFARSVTTIGVHAFEGCSALVSADMSNCSLTSVGDYAFRDCTSLRSVTIPDCACIVGTYSFARCTGLERAVVGSTDVGVHAFEDCTALRYVEIRSAVVSIGEYSFNGCAQMDYLFLGSTVRSIGECAFLGCSSLTSVSIPTYLTYLGPGAFAYCSALDSLTMPASLNAVVSKDMPAFEGCCGLRTLYLYGSHCHSYDPNPESDSCYLYTPWFQSRTVFAYVRATTSLTEIGNYMFFDCVNLRSAITWVESIGVCSFCGCTSLNTVSTERTTSIGASAFYGCTSLKTVDVSHAVSLGYCSFYCCSSLENVTFNSGLKTVPAFAFAYCTSLYDIDFGNVNDICDYAFYGCSALTSLSLSGSASTLYTSAFAMCSSLTYLDLGGTRIIGQYAFYGCSILTDLALPDHVKLVYGGAFAKCECLEHVSFGHRIDYVDPNAFDLSFFTTDGKTQFTSEMDFRDHTFTAIGLRFIEDTSTQSFGQAHTETLSDSDDSLRMFLEGIELFALIWHITTTRV